MHNHRLQNLSGADHVHALMQELGFKKCLSPTVLTAALELHEDYLPRVALLQQARHFFSERACIVPAGLENLPAVWLRRLPWILWATRKRHWEALPYFISSVSVESGILQFEYRQEQLIQVDRLTTWDQLRVTVNLSLQPNYWRSLSVPEERELWESRPDLRQELLMVL